MASSSNQQNKSNIQDDPDLSSESVEVLRERLNNMKKLIQERQQVVGDVSEIFIKPQSSSGIIDGNFLSIAFGGALLVIITVSIYAFYNLYHAVLKKFPSKHTEL